MKKDDMEKPTLDWIGAAMKRILAERPDESDRDRDVTLPYAHIFSRWRNWCLKLAVCPVDSIFYLVFTRGE